MEQLEASRSIPEPTMTTVLKSALPHLVSFDPGLAITPEKSALSRKGKLSSDKLDILESPLRNLSPKPLKPASGILVSTQELPDKPNSRLKPGILSSGSIDWLPTKLISLSNDPMLDVTPEKPTTSVLKTQRKTIGKNLDASNGEEKKTLRVRFDVPESSKDDEEELDPVKESSLENDTSDQGPVKLPFRQTAALYSQRNPLADITDESSLQESSDNTTFSSDTLTSTNSENSSLFNQISRFIENNPPSNEHQRKPNLIQDIPQTLPQVTLKTVTKKEQRNPTKPNAVRGRIINVVTKENKTLPKATIDRLTKPKSGSAIPEDQTTRKNFLKKKSGLSRHEHSIYYAAEPQETQSVFSEPTYNSTLRLGQELQELKIAEFDADDMVKKKLEDDETLRNYVAERTAEATNIAPDEKLYDNLVNIEVTTDDFVPINSTNWKRMKPRPFKSKKTKYGVPNIMDTFTNDLYYEEPIFDLETIKVPSVRLQQAPLESIMCLDKQSQIWDNV